MRAFPMARKEEPGKDERTVVTIAGWWWVASTIQAVTWSDAPAVVVKRLAVIAR